VTLLIPIQAKLEHLALGTTHVLTPNSGKLAVLFEKFDECDESALIRIDDEQHERCLH
jgi:hypothetical protein